MCPGSIKLSNYDDVSEYQNVNVSVYPNPSWFNNISFKVSNGSHFDACKSNEMIGQSNIAIYNVKGQLVKSSNEFQTKNGESVFIWNQKDNRNKQVASGMYFYRIQSNEDVLTGKLLILKNNE
jgi:flagellar hook assembly protein FlgD